MADTPETPTTPPKAPTPPRRRAATRKTPAKPVAKTAAPAKASVAEDSKPAAKRQAAPKPRSTARANPTAPRRAAPKTAAKPATAKSAAPKSTAEKVTDKVGGKWGAAAVAGGVAAIGVAATAALLSLRGSVPKATPVPGASAHTPDGTDASKSFGAGIADEGTIPDKV